MLGGAATAVTLFGVYVFWPTIVIEPYALTDPTNPFAQQFSVQNASLYSIYNVEPACFFPPDSGYFLHNMATSLQREELGELKSGAKTTLTCGINDSRQSESQLKVDPRVTYTLPFIKVQRCYKVEFIGKPGSNGGTYVWTYHGTAKCNFEVPTT